MAQQSRVLTTEEIERLEEEERKKRASLPQALTTEQIESMERAESAKKPTPGVQTKRKKSIWESFIPSTPPTATPRETLEGLGSAASGLAAFPASVGTSVWLMNQGLKPAAAEKLGQILAEKITYKPTTEGGQALAEGFGGIFKPIEAGFEFAAKTAFPKSEEGQAAVRIGLATAMLLMPYVGKGIKGFIRGKVKAGVDVTPGELKAIAKVSKGAPAEVLAKVEQVTQAPVEQLLTKIRSAKPLLEEQKALYTKERGERIGSFEKTRAEGNIRGEALSREFNRQQKGELSKIDIEPIYDLFDQPTRDSLHTMVWENKLLTPYEKGNTANALSNLLNGKLPQPAQLDKLHKVFGAELTRAIKSKADLFTRAKEFGLEALNVPRTAMSIGDLSMGFRQAIITAARHPKIFFKTVFYDQVKYFLKEENLLKSTQEIASRKNYPLAKKYDLALMELDASLVLREEKMIGAGPLEKIPVIGKLVRASNRAYTGGLNKIRMDIFDKLISKWEKIGFNPLSNDPKTVRLMSKTASFVNNITGRGSLGKTFSESAVLLNAALFSPRLISSRVTLLNPFYYITLPKHLRAEAIKTMLSFVGAGTVVVGGLKLALGDKVGVEEDSNSADFMKVKVGKTRIDPWGGFQQYVRFLAQMATGKVKSTTTGRIKKLGEGYRADTREDLAIRFAQYKASPIASAFGDILRGKTVMGEPLTISNQVLQRFVPMVWQDMWDIVKEDPELWPTGLFGIFGVGIQTYRDRGPRVSPELRDKILSTGR